jgi:gliding motility-associated lipoprotein GldH
MLFACDSESVYDQYQSVGNAWHKDSIMQFKTPKLVGQYDIFINIRDYDDYPFSNIFLIAKIEQNKKTTIVDTLEYQMAAPDGSLLGNGYTDIKDNKLLFKENIKLEGDYTIKVAQAIRSANNIEGVKELKGITEIGIRIEKK